MSQNSKYNITNINLEDDYYNIEQSLVRNKYKVTDKNDETVLKGKQKMLKMKEEFPFVDSSGQEVFTVKASGILDIAGDYALIDDVTGEEVVILDEEWTFAFESWKIRDPDTEEVIASIESKNKIVSALRHLSEFANIIPNKYEIFDSNNKKIGEISGNLSFKDSYEVSVEKLNDIPREAIMASACIIDALENK